MSLLDQPEAQALLNDADVTPKTVKGFAGRLIEFLQRYLPKFYRSRAASQRHSGHTRPDQRFGAQDLRADRHPGRPAAQTNPVLRRRGQVGRRGCDDGVARPCPRGTGKLGWRRGYRPQRLPQERDGILWRRPSMVRPAGQTGQLPGRCLPGLRRLVGLWPVGPPALPAQGLGGRRRTPIEMPCPPGNSVPGEVADRAGSVGPELAWLAPWLDHRR